MDQHIEELFEAAPPVEWGELSKDPKYTRCFSQNLALEDAIKARLGPEAHALLMEFLDSYYEIERFDCLHYFYQGYLAGRKERLDGREK